MASAASPTPMGTGGSFSGLGRRTSARNGVRRPRSRQQLNHNEANPVSAYAAAATTSRQGKAQTQQAQPYPSLNDSSDDEMPVPMKLSALTKALLNDCHAPEGSRAAGIELPPSPPPIPALDASKANAVASSASSMVQERDPGRESVRVRETRRRAGSTQLPSSRPTSPARSRETSPAPRRRVVRLSGTPGFGIQGSILQQPLRRSLSASAQRKRSESKERGGDKHGDRPGDRPSERSHERPESHSQSPSLIDVNTPIVPVRQVKIAIGSSGQRARSGGSSGVSSGASTGPSDKRPGGQGERGMMPEDPATVGRLQTATAHSSMRVKRAGGKLGGFLSGPARRGLRRPSEEDSAMEQAEREASADAGPEQKSLQASNVDQPGSSFSANQRDHGASSGSPVGGRYATRAVVRKKTSLVSLAPQEPKQAERSHAELAYDIPSLSKGAPIGQDKENEAPATHKRYRTASSSGGDLEGMKPLLPCSMVGSVPKHTYCSPERKILATKSNNTPRRAAPPPPPRMSVVETATAAAGASTTATARKKQVLLRVNGRTYTRIDCIGRGGSGKVYRVSAESGKMLALKRVSLENADENTVRGFKGEIDLLKRLHGVDRVIQLLDHELNLEKHMLSVLMEVGELDFNTLLKSRQGTAEGAKLDPVFIRHYWKEMLECVQAVHARDVVHSDLKPANFVLVQGRLKLIDFGIANAIQTDMTVNVHRETQIGTPNYMSPESLMDSNQYAFTSAQNGKFCIPPPLQHQRGAPKLMKLGKPSDVWSLGCMLYQMVYGLPPFGKISNQMSRCQAIINWAHTIDMPDATEDGQRVPPSMIRTMRRCLKREQRERPTCDELLADSDPFLYPQELDPSVYEAARDGRALPVTEELLGRIIQSVVQRCRERLPNEGEAVATWPSAYWASVKKAVTDAAPVKP